MKMKQYFSKDYFYTHVVRTLSLCLLLLLPTSRMFGAGWTPTDAGLILNFEQGDKFLLSVMLDMDKDGVQEEYFLCHYPTYTYPGNKPFKYTNNNDTKDFNGNYIKLIRQAAGATTYIDASVWTVDTATNRVVNGKNYALGGIAYTMKSHLGYTLTTDYDNDWKFYGRLSNEETDSPKKAHFCDVAFVVPTIQARTNMDPENTLKKKVGDQWAFDGKTGTGFLGMTYREVYMFEKPKKNMNTNTYTNMALVRMDSTSGKASFAFRGMSGSLGNYDKMQRTLFRIYPLNKPFVTIPSSYYFAWDVQNYLRYRNTDNMPSRSADSTEWHKIYTLDHMYPMHHVGGGIFKTDSMLIPVTDSTYFYVGYRGKYCSRDRGDRLGGSTASSHFRRMVDNLRVRPMIADGGDFLAPKGAYGQMVVDTMSSSENLGVSFEPAGYFLRTNSRMNIKLHRSSDGTYWQTEQAWTITSAEALFTVKATLYTDSVFSESDQGADIEGWSTLVSVNDVSLLGGGSIPLGTTGWARIYPGKKDANGGMVFVPADNDAYIRYHNNGNYGDSIPDQYAPATGDRTVTIQDARLMAGYEFAGWATSPNGAVVIYPKESSNPLKVGTEIDFDNLPAGLTLTDGVLHLYAKATYTGDIHVAFSFLKDDGKRYFLMYPGGAPRYSHARHFDDWTNVWQGLGNANNTDPNYISTFKLVGKPTCIECEPYEYVLDPGRYTQYGSVDSLTFYDRIQPEDDEYLGLYYVDPYTIIANNNWAGLFQSSEGWPNPSSPCIDSTRLASSHYLTDLAAGIGHFTRSQRPTDPALVADTVVHYNAGADQFDHGTMAQGTDFMISGVGVVDAHYVILPDTTDPRTPWVDTVTFSYRENEQVQQRVWSELIGKQLMAQMTVGNEIIYFHPNVDKTVTTPEGLNLSSDYRMTQTFTFIPDRRGGSLDTLSEAFRPTMSIVSGQDFCRLLTSGVASPIEIKDDEGNYIDICDTIRVRLVPRTTSKIKDYYGRWKTGSTGLHMGANGTRYRDIIVRTKTYHYNAPRCEYKLVPVSETYDFSPLADKSRQLNFRVMRLTYCELHDNEHHMLKEVLVNSEDVTATIPPRMLPSFCRFAASSTGQFSLVTDQTVGDHATVKTVNQNMSGAERDTLTVAAEIIPGGVKDTLRAQVPLMQATLSTSQLIWSVENGKDRYFILASSAAAPVYRKYATSGSLLLQEGSTNQLIIGAATAANTNKQYLTPWRYTDVDVALKQLKMYADLPGDVTRSFTVVSETTPQIGAEGAASILTYEYDTTYITDKANFEERVRIKYGANKWLKFTVTSGTPALSLTTEKAQATVFSWTYLQQEYNLENNGAYPSQSQLEFGYARNAKDVQTRYKAFRWYSMLLNNQIAYCSKEECVDISELTRAAGDWKTNYDISIIRDARDLRDPEGNAIASGANGKSGLTYSVSSTDLITTVTPDEDLRENVLLNGKYENIVDTLDVRLSLRDGAETYYFQGDWSSFTRIEDARVKIPLVLKTYHEGSYDEMVTTYFRDKSHHTFPSTITAGVNDSCIFTLQLERRQGTSLLDVDNHVASVEIGSNVDMTDSMHLNNMAYAEVRLQDESGKRPTWCHISGITANTIRVKCTANGLRTPRTATIRVAYVVMVKNEGWRYVNALMTVTQPSKFQYANNQHLVHSQGASGDELRADGMQQVHENKRIIYYYNPKPYNEADQEVELLVRERGYYGWWRWYREGNDDDVTPHDVGNTDIPDSVWINPPLNYGGTTEKPTSKYPYRVIGDSVWVYTNPEKTDSVKQLVTMGRYTVFRNPAHTHYSKNDPPAKTPRVKPPHNKKTVTYAVDISNYYDNLPLSMTSYNQIDTAVLDTMRAIVEPTLSLREVFELHPWTEMADTLDHYKSAVTGSSELLDNGEYPLAGEKYMEDHVVMAPTGNRLLLRTEQRYCYANIDSTNHSESLLGYYIHDDNWSTWAGNEDRQDTMIWCVGWDAEEVAWYTYNPKTKKYSPCSYQITVGDDFLNVPAHTGLPSGTTADTVYYCLRVRSMATTGTAPAYADDDPQRGNYWYNICRYKVIFHDPKVYGPLAESTKNGVTKAIITNDEIEQTYEVMERLNFDYNKPGSEYQVYPHPLPWADASYGYSYPMSSALPDNRHHNNFAPNFPGVGEYGLINRIPYDDYWSKMEQHGGAENGYMIYCDGMSSAGQVAALTLHAKLCEGQKMFFSGYVGNPGRNTRPNFTFSVQGSNDSINWKDISSFMTGDIKASNQWYQIYFPIEQEGSYDYFRVRIFNVASDFNGNDFIIDDMCVFATKPPLIAYQANTKCSDTGENDSITNVVLRVDYQGFTNASYNGTNVYYTVEQIKNNDTTFVFMEDGYLNGDVRPASAPVSVDTLVYGSIPMPSATYEPTSSDSIFDNLDDLIRKFTTTNFVFKKGYIFENLDGKTRPVLYVIHEAKLTPDNTYKVRMSLAPEELKSSICAMTSDLKVSSLMALELNGEEKETKMLDGMCPNTTYDISMRVKGTLHQDNTAPVDINGSCMNDWLLFGDTTEAASLTRYGHKYRDIVKVVKGILRSSDPEVGTNLNQKAPNLAAVSHNEMLRVQRTSESLRLSSGLDPYDVLCDLVNKGFLQLYQSKVTVTVTSGDSVQYVVFPIVGTGSDYMHQRDMEVCPMPLFIKLKPSTDGAVSMRIGGMIRPATEANTPVVQLADSVTASRRIAIPIDYLDPLKAIHSVELLSTDDPDYLEGVHTLTFLPNKVLGEDDVYYQAGDSIILTPAAGNNYQMRPGYSYTFGIVMQTTTGALTLTRADGKGECPIGTVMFTVTIVPDRLRWAPIEGSNAWHNPMNWIGVNSNDEPIHVNARYAPLASSSVIIPAMAEGSQYPELVNPESLAQADSIKKMGYQYNTCDKIRFMPATVIGQQQFLTYNKVVVDMSTPQKKWTLRSTPVTGMLSGDLFMANADLAGETAPWEAGEFDANGRNYKTGNASFWLSMYSRSIKQMGNGDNIKDSTRTASAEWSRAANSLIDSLYPAQGWAIYTRINSEEVDTGAVIRLPKNDDVFYYFNVDGEKQIDTYVDNIRSIRDRLAGGSGKSGKLAYSAASTTYTLTNGVASDMFVFGNPTMGYIDIWGFIADNRKPVVKLNEEIQCFTGSGFTSVSKLTAEATEDVITEQRRYLPPMNAIVLKVPSAATTCNVTLNANRILTAVAGGGAPAPGRNAAGRRKGIMTVTAVNPVADICTSQLLIGQGYHDDVRDGEDAMLTTVNIDKYSSSTPSTPFNIYAVEDGLGLSIDLRDEVLNIPVSFNISNLPFDPVTYLWFTGVNAIDGELVLYDALTGDERPIMDGICLAIPTPEYSHLRRYYIRRRGFTPGGETTDPVATGSGVYEKDDQQAVKIIQNGHILVLRNGHVYTMFGQKIR